MTDRQKQNCFYRVTHSLVILHSIYYFIKAYLGFLVVIEVDRNIKSKSECPPSLQRMLWVEKEGEDGVEERPFSINEILDKADTDRGKFILFHTVESVKAMFVAGSMVGEEEMHDVVRTFQVSGENE